jgi:hypothetical protein
MEGNRLLSKMVMAKIGRADKDTCSNPAPRGLACDLGNPSRARTAALHEGAETG